jgi:hypothetical protein
MAKNYVDLTTQQRIKCAQFLAIYGDEERSVTLTDLIEKAGDNSLKNVTTKLNFLVNSKPTDQAYDDELYAAFPLNQEATVPNIMGTICKTRAAMGLYPYTSRLKENCIRDFTKLFIVKPVLNQVTRINPKTKQSRLVMEKSAYIPVFKLKP